jgi:hypothetical protein
LTKPRSAPDTRLRGGAPWGAVRQDDCRATNE